MQYQDPSNPEAKYERLKEVYRKQSRYIVRYFGGEMNFGNIRQFRDFCYELFGYSIKQIDEEKGMYHTTKNSSSSSLTTKDTN